MAIICPLLLAGYYDDVGVGTIALTMEVSRSVVATSSA